MFTGAGAALESDVKGSVRAESAVRDDDPVVLPDTSGLMLFELAVLLVAVDGVSASLAGRVSVSVSRAPLVTLLDTPVAELSPVAALRVESALSVSVGVEAVLGTTELPPMSAPALTEEPTF